MSTALEPIKAPFPWFGGKSRAAEIIWARFGNVPNYVEPFAGSLAVLLGRPHEAKTETVNDLDCYVANFWRAIANTPEETAMHADWPVNEADLIARHRWLVAQTDFRDKMRVDPEYFDAKIAGWWVWGLCSWIGSGWCVQRRNGDQPEKIPHLGDAGMGINRRKSRTLATPERGSTGSCRTLATPEGGSRLGSVSYPKGSGACGSHAGNGTACLGIRLRSSTDLRQFYSTRRTQPTSTPSLTAQRRTLPHRSANGRLRTATITSSVLRFVGTRASTRCPQAGSACRGRREAATDRDQTDADARTLRGSASGFLQRAFNGRINFSQHEYPRFD